MALVFEQFYLTCLSHASYLIGSDGVAAIIDPQRDVDVYLAAAGEHGLEIQYIIETHLHADFVSGHQELAQRTGAQIAIGARAGATFPHIALHEGDEIRFGRCRLRILETPGHTLESICVLVTDLDRSADPFAVLTGDTLFIGDVGRPDLAPGYNPEELAAMLYDSLHRKLLALPDRVEVYPAHGAGSLCGRHMSSERMSTIGIQRATNYALRAADRNEFIRLVTAELPQRPKYFERDVDMNREGAPALDEMKPVPELAPEVVVRLQRAGAVILDTRNHGEFCQSHIPGSVHIGLDGQYASWAGTLLDVEDTVVLVAEDAERVNESRLRLARVGIEGVAGSLAGGLRAWTKAGLADEHMPLITVEQLSRIDAATLQIVDVRKKAEWDDGHVAGAVLKPLHELLSLLDGLDRRRPLAVYCKSGYRSAIGCSILKRAGFREVLNVSGGFDAWCAAKLPVTKDPPSAAAASR